MLLRILFSLLGSCLFIQAFAQQANDTLFMLEVDNKLMAAYQYYYTNTDSAIYYFKELDALVDQRTINDDTQDAYEYQVLALSCLTECSGLIYDLKSMPNYFQKAEKVYDEQATYFDTIDINKAYLLRIKQSKAYYYYRIGNHDNAQISYQELIDEKIKISPLDSIGLAINYDYIGFILFRKGSYDEAINYFKQALRIVPQSSNNRQALFHTHLAQNYDALKQKDKAISNYLKAEKRFSSNSKNAIISLYGNMASYYQDTHADSVQFYFDKAIDLHKPNDPTFIKTYQKYGESMLKSGKVSEALENFKKALSLRQKKYSKGHPLLAQTHSSLAEAYLKTNNYALANDHLNQALLVLDSTYDPKSQKLPSLENSISNRELLRALHTKADMLNEQNKLALALEHYQACIHLIQQIRKSYGSEASRQYLSAETAPIYDAAIELAFKLKQKKEAFKLVEQGKAIGLMDAIKNAGAKKFANIPDSLIEKELALKLQIAYYENLKYESAEIGDSAKIKIADNFLFDLKINYQKQIQELEKNYPAYYQLKYAPHSSSLEEIQASLNDETAIIEYHLTEKIGYRFIIQKNEFEAESFDIPTDFKKQVQAYLRNLSDVDLLRKDYAQSVAKYERYNKEIYALLFPASYFQENSLKRLIIIPDDILCHLPFETLSSNETKLENYQNVNWLINDYSFSYNYSAAHLTELKKQNKAKKAKHNFGGFAATYTGDYLASSTRSGLNPLPAAIDEVEQIVKITGGKAWLKSDATETRFKEEAPKYKILHLAMHGVLDDKNPLFSKLMFTPSIDTLEDNQLSALEIYSLDLQADLSVLSACKTGVGEIKEGEGVMSLSRAFAYAGCSSMVMSLWNVPDAETNELMQTFYKHLKKGNTKDLALQKAKLNYLEGKDKYQSHPAYWAGFINSGDTKTIKFDSSFPLKSILLGLVALGLIFYLTKKR